MHRLTWFVVCVPAVALVAGCGQKTVPDVASAGPDTPGWTGRTVVVGTSSTIGGDAEATEWAQKWGVGRRN